MVAEATLSIIAAGVLALFKTASKNGRGIKPVPLSPSRSGISASTPANAPVALATLLDFLLLIDVALSLFVAAASLTDCPINAPSTRRAFGERFL